MNYVPPSKISLDWVARTLKNSRNSRNIYFLTNLVSKIKKNGGKVKKLLKSETYTVYVVATLCVAV
jgi:hypothetical protein